MDNWSLNLLNKVQLRQTLLATRQAMSEKEQTMAAKVIAEWFIRSPLFAYQNIACYLACKGEVNCMSVIQEIWRAKKTCYLPLITADQQLEFARYEPDDVLTPNRYQILEPQQNEKIPLAKLDLVLVPLVGFDLEGNRLGMGAGYYDKTFSALTQRPLLVGLAYEWQCVESIPADVWDVKLDGVITERKYYSF